MGRRGAAARRRDFPDLRKRMRCREEKKKIEETKEVNHEEGREKKEKVNRENERDKKRK